MKLFPEYQSAYNDHIDFNEEFLPHVFFGETLNEDLPIMLTTGDEEKLQRIFDYIEFVTKNGDIEVQEIITTTILARLGDEPKILKIAFKYMGTETIKASKEIETFWGREN
ncbi:hypothetical protein J6TS2_31380 [Heyndrickxia sporothermodurans]|nr:hypothetical protein J6TS2_31380 [Heyndrickxia sporothermodurans]